MEHGPVKIVKVLKMLIFKLFKRAYITIYIDTSATASISSDALVRKGGMSCER